MEGYEDGREKTKEGIPKVDFERLLHEEKYGGRTRRRILDEVHDEDEHVIARTCYTRT